MTRNTVAAGFLSFALMGAAGGSYGQAIPPLRAEHGLGAGEAGVIITIHAIAALLGVGAYTLTRRWTLRLRLILATVSFITGCGVFGTAHVWPLTLLATFLIGFGFGIAGNAYNTSFAVSFGKKSVIMLTLINAVFGIGSLLGPLIVGIIGAGHFRAVYLAVAIGALAPLLLLVFTNESTFSTELHAHHGSQRPSKAIVAAFAGLLFLEVGIESSSGAWINTHLTNIGVSSPVASFVTGGFWSCMAIGRLLIVPLSRKFSESQIVAVSMLVIVPLYALANIGKAGVFAYAFAGFFMAPMFPCIMTWAARRTKNADHVGTILYASALVGSGVVPVIIGKAIDLTSANCVPNAFVLIAALFLMITSGLYRSRDRHSHPEPLDLLKNTEPVI